MGPICVDLRCLRHVRFDGNIGSTWRNVVGVGIGTLQSGDLMPRRAGSQHPQVHHAIHRHPCAQGRSRLAWVFLMRSMAATLRT